MKYNVGQVTKFSCVRNSTPTREIIHQSPTAAHLTILSNVAPTSKKLRRLLLSLLCEHSEF